jgi:hypothetical protein
MQHKLCNTSYATQIMPQIMQHKLCSTNYATQIMPHKLCNTNYATNYVTKIMQHKLCNTNCATQIMHLLVTQFPPSPSRHCNRNLKDKRRSRSDLNGAFAPYQCRRSTLLQSVPYGSKVSLLF